MARLLAYLASAALIAGCAAGATGPEFSLAPIVSDKGMVYVYRPVTKFNEGGYANVFVNGEKKFPLRDKGYAVLALAPGTYELKIEGSQFGTNWWPPPATRTLGVEAGQEYFVRVIPALPPGVAPGPHLFTNNISRALVDLVPKAQALAEIRELRLIED